MSLKSAIFLIKSKCDGLVEEILMLESTLEEKIELLGELSESLEELESYEQGKLLKEESANTPSLSIVSNNSDTNLD